MQSFSTLRFISFTLATKFLKIHSVIINFNSLCCQEGEKVIRWPFFRQNRSTDRESVDGALFNYLLTWRSDFFAVSNRKWSRHEHRLVIRLLRMLGNNLFNLRLETNFFFRLYLRTAEGVRIFFFMLRSFLVMDNYLINLNGIFVFCLFKSTSFWIKNQSLYVLPCRCSYTKFKKYELLIVREKRATWIWQPPFSYWSSANEWFFFETSNEPRSMNFRSDPK